MTAETPAQIRERHLLVLGPVGEVSTGIPLAGIRVDLRVEMNVVEEVNLRI